MRALGTSRSLIVVVFGLLAVMMADAGAIVARSSDRHQPARLARHVVGQPSEPPEPRARATAKAPTWPLLVATFTSGARSAIEIVTPGHRPRIVFRAPPDYPVRQAVWSADHRFVLFTRTVVCAPFPSSSEIWRLDLTNGKARRLLAPGCGTRYFDLATSPDGRWMAFDEISDRPGGSYSTLMLARIDGSDAHELMPLSAPPMNPVEFGDFHPSFAPDSNHLVFARVDLNGGGGLFITTRTGHPVHEIVALTISCPINADPVWAPNGSRIAYIDQPAGPPDGDVYVVTPQGTARRRLTFTAVPTRIRQRRLFQCYDIDPWMNVSDYYGNLTNAWPAWSPDSRILVFGSDRNHRHDCIGAFELFAVPSAGGPTRQLTNVPHTWRGTICQGDPPSNESADFGR